MLAQEASPPKTKFIDVLGQNGLPRMDFTLDSSHSFAGELWLAKIGRI